MNYAELNQSYFVSFIKYIINMYTNVHKPYCEHAYYYTFVAWSDMTVDQASFFNGIMVSKKNFRGSLAVPQSVRKLPSFSFCECPPSSAEPPLLGLDAR